MDERKYRNIVKSIKNSNLGYDFQNYLFQYLAGVRNGTRVNDFVDADILCAIIMKFVNGEVVVEKNKSYERA